jgi:hypothetical protein
LRIVFLWIVSGTVCISEACPAQIAANLGKRGGMTGQPPGKEDSIVSHPIIERIFLLIHFPADLREKA